MGKKRKVLSSEPDSSTVTPESEQPQYQAQIETEPEMDPIEEPEDLKETNEEQESPEEDMDEDENGERRTKRGLEGSQRRRRGVHKLADADPAHRKIFVHGLGWDANAETLTSEFGKYGEIEDCKSVCDKVSGKSKGYGFILFKHRIGAKKALKEPQKKIGNRMTSCQLASAGPVLAPPPTAPPVSEYTQRKIFVSNVAAEIDPQKLLEFFSKYGEIEDGPLGLDKQTGKPKGFCLFVYKSVETASPAVPSSLFQEGEREIFIWWCGAGAGTGHLMAPSGPSMGFNPAVAAPALTRLLGRTLTALLASQGAGLGINNLLGGFGAPMNQGVPPVMNNQGYGNQPGGSYGNQQVMQGGYQNPQMGKVLVGRSRVQVHTWVMAIR
ncbi:RNA-binding (RRM/RBD/RNP motifs) family protein [Actinidia rufa]|uniref:RNA-binding (RRM/RBD/RNP motifs) family protein n=1 Tax=Actinidia rufa TaxID=165716 RepID=A0A7J0DLN9_9ERIC|nr:RNA-binding (RRM/RBD/RNP motifs) family protein [Actinidia rufa]